MSRLPSRSLPTAAAVLWLACMTVLALLYMTIPTSPDQAQFDWMAFIATQGRPFYVGSFDMNWPGAMWLHEAGIRIFGAHAWTWRLTDFLLMLAFTLGGAMFLWRAGWPSAPFIFLFLYPSLYITAGPWMAGQRDIIAGGFLIVACALATPGWRAERTAVICAGLCVAAAVLIRPTFLSFLVGLIFLEALPIRVRHERRLGRLVRSIGFVLGFVVGLGAAVLAGVALGNIDDWYQQSVEFSLSLYIGEAPRDWRYTLYVLFVRSWHWISVLAALGLLIWAWRDRLSHPLVLLLGAAATSALSFAVQNKGFGYHLGGVLPVMILFIAVAFDSLNTQRVATTGGIRRQAALALLVLSAPLALAGTGSKFLRLEENARNLLAGGVSPAAGYGLTEGERRRIIDMIRETTTDTDSVIVYGTNYELPYRARRLPAYRYFTPAADRIAPEFAHFDAWMMEIDTALTFDPPAFVIVESQYLEGYIDGEAQTAGQILNRLLTHLSTDHEVAFQNDDVVVYRRAP